MGAISSSSTTLPGATITSTGGSTTLPTASAGDFAGATNPLDTPDATYPSMSTAHVAVFRTIGTSEDLLAQIAAEQPDAATLDAYIQDEIMQNPEAWDARTGQQTGTTRAGLMQLMPGQPLGGRAQTSGVTPPAIFTPTSSTASGGGPGMGTGLLVGAGVLGLGVGGFLLHKRALAKAVEGGAQAIDAVRIQQLGMLAPEGLGVMGGGAIPGAAHAAFGATGGGSVLHQAFTSNMAHFAIEQGDNGALHRAMLLNVLGTGTGAPLDQASAMNSVLHGMGVPDPQLSRILTTADNHGADQGAVLDAAVKLALIDKLDGRGAASMLSSGSGTLGGAAHGAQMAGSLDDVIARLAVMRAAQ